MNLKGNKIIIKYLIIIIVKNGNINYMNLLEKTLKMKIKDNTWILKLSLIYGKET